VCVCVCVCVCVSVCVCVCVCVYKEGRGTPRAYAWAESAVDMHVLEWQAAGLSRRLRRRTQNAQILSCFTGGGGCGAGVGTGKWGGMECTCVHAEEPPVASLRQQPLPPLGVDRTILEARHHPLPTCSCVRDSAFWGGIRSGGGGSSSISYRGRGSSRWSSNTTSSSRLGHPWKRQA
jgi:hypothetical protein